MKYPKLAFVLHALATLAPVSCTTGKVQKGNEFANPGKIFSEMEAAVEAGGGGGGGGELSIEKSLESLRRIVKRVAPEQNGEYQVYQGVSGQPGVDFPALTSIPATSFTCRGKKGGYYADLETNCQVFHICDNGRKISFLCPNGTIFQQSQLICDWWFKVECSKSAEYYEQSSEQLAEDERKRTENRRTKQNYDRENSRDYVDVQSLDYDGKQNARVNPSYDDQSANRIKANRQLDNPSFTENRDPLYSEAKDFQGNSRPESPNYRHSTPHRQAPRPNEEHDDSNRYTTVSPESRNNAKRVQNYQSPVRSSNPREDKVSLKRQKFKNVGRGQTNTSPGNTFNAVSSNTPRYMESTTFRVNTPGPKESQQFAESAAFVSNRGNRFNEGSGSHQFYYQLYPNRQDDPPNNNNRNDNRDLNSERKGLNDVHENVDHSEPTTASTENVSYETTGHFWPTTTTSQPPCHTDHQEFGGSQTVTPSPVQLIPTASTSNFGTREPKSEKFNYNTGTTENHRSSDYAATTPSVFAETTNYYQYNEKRGTEANFVPTTETPDDYRSTIYPQSEQTHSTDAPNTDYYGATEALSTSQGNQGNFNDRSDSHSTLPASGNFETTRYTSSVSQQYRQDSDSLGKSTEKPVKTTFPYKPYTLTEKSLSPYDTSFTYKQGKVMSTLGPYVPFTKNYYTTTKPSATDSPSNVTSIESHSALKSLIPKLKQSSSSPLGKSKDHFGGAGYLPEKEHAMGMLNSLRNLVGESEVSNTSVKASYSSAPGSSTLHSLALYFSTATDSFDSGETIDSSIAPELEEETKEAKVEKHSVQVEAIPTGLLTQNTITSYAELFKLNNALEGNATEGRASAYDPEDYNEDLDVQHSSSSLEDQEKSNSTKLRELAQVFTHALSAYLLDPDAFKKVLTDIRPTEPPTTTETTDDWFSTTTAYPTTLQDDSLTTREKDEVLDFSEAENDLARLQVTNTYPTTNTVLPTTAETTITAQDDASTLPTESKTPIIRMTTARVTNTVVTKSSSPKEDVTSRSRVGGFQNNSVNQVTPQGRAKNFGESHRENYVSSTTPAPQAHYSSSYGWTRQVTSKKPEQQLTPPFYDNNVRPSKEAESGKPQTREPKRNEYPHFLVPPFSSTSSSAIHRGRGINFVINKNEQSSFTTTSERPTSLPSKDFQPPTFSPSRHYEPPQTTPQPSKHFEPPHSTPFTARPFEELSTTVAPLKLVEEPPTFVPSRQYEPPASDRNYNRVRFFKSSQVNGGESGETLVTARTGYAKFRNFNRFDVHTDTSEKKSGKSTTVAPETINDSTVSPTTTLRPSTIRIEPTTIRPSTNFVARTTEAPPSTSTLRPATESRSFETTVIGDDREAVTKRNRGDGSPNGGLSNDHWTSSPAVTRLWETSVFIDPKKINQGLASDSTVPSTTEIGTTQRTVRGQGDATHEAEFGDSSEDLGEHSVDISKDDSNWGWVAKDKDSPTAFTLLPAAYSFENTGTPKPLITTRSSITTTITSSVTSTNSIPQESLVASLLPYSKNRVQANATENDVAQKLFGKLNATSSTTLMNVMRQADNNETVRQLVLLLVSYCRDPANHTMEREKDNLLDALLRMPVNEFASAESRNIVSSFDRHNIPGFRARALTNSTSSRTTGMLAQASTHSGFRKARKYRTTTEGSNAFERTEKLVVTDNSLPEEDTTVADNRALELLRSLYSIANKWG